MHGILSKKEAILFFYIFITSEFKYENIPQIKYCDPYQSFIMKWQKNKIKLGVEFNFVKGCEIIQITQYLSHLKKRAELDGDNLFFNLIPVCTTYHWWMILIYNIQNNFRKSTGNDVTFDYLWQFWVLEEKKNGENHKYQIFFCWKGINFIWSVTSWQHENLN